MLHLNFTPFPTLRTDRLILRQLKDTDENEIFAIRSDDRVNEFLNRQKANSIEDARDFIHKIDKNILKNESLYWGVALQNDNKLIGTICFWNISIDKDTAEIGYELQPPFQGKGYIQEAIEKVIQYGFENMKLVSIVAEPEEGNLKSIKILEKKGFKRISSSDSFEMGPHKIIAYSLNRPVN